ncbi:response regulator [Acidisoma cellulosilytica]|uniref:Response regulator n=1 Tax=Acidisoma cellulosilyticum TaxID=2802395 RepID=A0A964E6N3_9PROT|nr:response regulator [Acidisoma cellulosilyticum]MCB8883188.1 response regulator [Acidisoma cellulosilyticum]
MSLTEVISIVDDDEDVRSATRSLMRSHGFTAHAFASAEAFLNSPLLHETTCLITDVQMPDIGGFELQAILLNLGITIPVIFITAFPETSVLRRAEAVGALAIYAKPFDGEAIISRIEEFTPSHIGGTPD